MYNIQSPHFVLTVFLILGFTVTPTAAAECAANTSVTVTLDGIAGFDGLTLVVQKDQDQDQVQKDQSAVVSGIIDVPIITPWPRHLSDSETQQTECIPTSTTVFGADDITGFTADNPEMTLTVNGQTVSGADIDALFASNPNLKVAVETPFDAEKEGLVVVQATNGNEMTVELLDHGFWGCVSHRLHGTSSSGVVTFVVPASYWGRSSAIPDYDEIVACNWITDDPCQNWGSTDCWCAPEASYDGKMDMPAAGEMKVYDITFGDHYVPPASEYWKIMGIMLLVAVIAIAITVAVVGAAEWAAGIVKSIVEGIVAKAGPIPAQIAFDILLDLV